MGLFIYLLVQSCVKSKTKTTHFDFNLRILVITMETKTKLFTILALLCVIFSACAVSAVDYNNGYYEVDYDDGPYDDDRYDVYDDDYYMHNAPQSQPAVNTSGNSTPHAAAGNAPAATNTLPATGLPVVALLGVCAVLGGAALYKRK